MIKSELFNFYSVGDLCFFGRVFKQIACDLEFLQGCQKFLHVMIVTILNFFKNRTRRKNAPEVFSTLAMRLFWSF